MKLCENFGSSTLRQSQFGVRSTEFHHVQAVQRKNRHPYGGYNAINQ